MDGWMANGLIAELVSAHAQNVWGLGEKGFEQHIIII